MTDNFVDMPRSEVVRRIRQQFGVTQAKLAVAMGTSIKTVQSYEQGWRNVPTRALVQLLVLLAIHRRREIDKVPCWEIRKCRQTAREDCPSYTIGEGQFCWFVSAGATKCPTDLDTADTDDDLLPCMGCEVIRRLLRTDDVPADGKQASDA